MHDEPNPDQDLAPAPLLLVTPRYGRGRGGLGVSAARVAGHLAACGPVEVIETTPDLPALTFEEAPPLVAGPVRRLRVSSAGERKTALQLVSDVLIRRARSRRPRAIAAFYAGELAHAAALTARLVDARLLVFARGNDIDLEVFSDGAGNALRALEQAARVPCVTHELARKVAAFAPAARPLVIGNGVDTATFRPGPPRAPGARPVVGMFGDFKAKKGLELVLATLDFDRFDLLLVGAPRGDTEKALHGFLTLYPERARAVRWHAYIHDEDELRARYAEVDLVCLPSTHEGMSNVMLEAMACGVPCVAGGVGGALDVIDDGVSGFLFDAWSGEALTAALDRAAQALASDAGGSIGRSARRVVEERFNLQREREAYRALLDAIG